GGIVGALLTGVFAVEQYGGTAGAFYGNVQQFINQCIGVVTVFVYDAVVSLILLKIVDLFIGLRVSEEVEREGLDLALHGEAVQSPGARLGRTPAPSPSVRRPRFIPGPPSFLRVAIPRRCPPFQCKNFIGRPACDG